MAAAARCQDCVDRWESLPQDEIKKQEALEGRSPGLESALNFASRTKSSNLHRNYAYYYSYLRSWSPGNTYKYYGDIIHSVFETRPLPRILNLGVASWR